MNRVNNIFKSCFIILVFALWSKSFGQAGNLSNDIGVFASANISYTCLGAGNYEIVLDVYAECGYFDGTLNNKDNYPITIQSASLGKSFNTSVIKPFNSVERDGVEINIFCPEQPSQCRTRDKNSLRGLKKYTFKTTINLDQLGKANDWKVFWSRNNRSAEISSIRDNQPIFSEATINNLTSCNSSVAVGVNTVLSIKINEADTIPLAATDPDGHRLRYSIVSPLQAVNTPINYSSGFNPTQPFGSNQTIKIENGQIIIPPISQPNVNASFDVLIEEFSGETKVGETRKAFQIMTLETENTAPVISGFNNTAGTEITLCVGESLNARITGSDADGDRMRFLFPPLISTTANIGFSGTFSNTTNPFLNFLWTPTAQHVGTHKVTVTLADDDCPVSLSTTKEFTITVNPIPTFNLGADLPYDCGNPWTLAPTVTGVGPFEYEWKLWSVNPLNPQDTIISPTVFSTNTSVLIDRPRQLELTVKDPAGCAKKDKIEIWNSLRANFNWVKYCVDQTTTFTDLSRLRGVSLVSRKWEIEVENGNYQTFTDSVIDITFPGQGVFDTRLTMEDNLGCVSIKDTSVTIVPHPTLALGTVDSCSIFSGTPVDGYDQLGVDFFDLTAYQTGDDRDSVRWTARTLGGILINQVQLPLGGFRSSYPEYAFPDSGFYVIETYTVSAAGCEDTKLDTIHIVQRPALALVTSSIVALNCADPDTLFRATVDSYFRGTDPLRFWFRDNRGIESAPVVVAPSDTFNIPASEVGSYIFFLEDVNGCKDIEVVSLVDPVLVDFGYDLICEEGAVQFRDTSSTSVGREIVEWDWTFGDGNTSNLANPTHTYSNQDNYRVGLTVTDSKGCSSSSELTVFYTFPTKNITITPDITVVKQCVEDEIIATYHLNPLLVYHFDTIRWKIIQANGTVDNDSTSGLIKSYIFKDTTSRLDINNIITFNRNPFNPIAPAAYCIDSISLSKDLTIFPKFDGEILDNRICIGDSGIFNFKRVSNPEIKVVSYIWRVFDSKNQLVEVSNDSIPQIFINDLDFLRGPKQLGIEGVFVDINGCTFVKDATIDVEEITAKSKINFDPVACQDEKVLFTLMAQQSPNVQYWQLNVNYTDSVGFGVYNSPKFDYDVIGSKVVSFPNQGVIPVSLFLIEKQQQTGKECRARLDTSILINDVPDYDITWDTVCSAVSPTTFINNSSIDASLGTILNYRWDFGDGTTAVSAPGEREVKHRYQSGGLYTVTVSATTLENCNESKAIFEVYVRPTPQVNYTADQDFLEAFETITFTDNSETYGASIDSSYWDFGALGVFENQLQAQIYWDEVGVYFIRHYIMTEDGCSDDSLFRIDLNTYLELPNAFSPNGDGVNDELFLIYKSIYELYDYKIYNRWGQQIFDAEGDITKSWDGTYKGVNQEVGVYVAHVKAIGAYNTPFDFKVNVRLIR